MDYCCYYDYLYCITVNIVITIITVRVFVTSIAIRDLRGFIFSGKYLIRSCMDP